jgi:hypothetical protein
MDATSAGQINNVKLNNHYTCDLSKVIVKLNQYSAPVVLILK